MEVLTTLLVILTVTQPFICLHPVIIWSQDSNQNSTFLLLIILIWFLPVCVHVVIKAIISPGVQRCKSVMIEGNSSNVVPSSESHALNESNEFERETSRRYNNPISKRNLEERQQTTTLNASNNNEKCSKRRDKLLKVFDLLIQVTQLSLFLITFSIATNHIVRIEFGIKEGRKEKRENLQDFVLPAIISVFIWMMSISFLLLSLGRYKLPFYWELICYSHFLHYAT